MRTSYIATGFLSHAIAGERTGEGARGYFFGKLEGTSWWLLDDVLQIPIVRLGQAIAKGCRWCPAKVV
jgi:hypothetical protein